MDCEQFRLACKYGKQYIEHHIKGRLHPANHRNALSGRYAGGPVPWGYVVDYDRHSATYKRFLRYEPHATLVVHHVFERFAAMVRPSVMELTRVWEREGRAWPFFGPEVDERRKRVLGQALTRSDGANGYRFHYRQAQHILTNVAYLGWCVHRGEVAWDYERSAPLICHEALVGSDLFWWCYDLVAGERPPWAPPRVSAQTTYYRPHHSRRASPDEVWFLTPGRVRCVTHGSRYSASKEATGSVRLECPSYDRQTGETAYLCPVIAVAPVEAKLIDAFRAELRLDARDVAHLAQIAQRRQGQRAAATSLVQQELAKQRLLLERAKRRALQVDDDGMAAEFLDEARRARQRIRELEAQTAQADAKSAFGADALRQAERAETLSRRIWETFPDWPRAAQSRVLSLALNHAVIGPVHRHALGFYIQWQGGSVSRREMVRTLGQHVRWSADEEEAIRRYYDVLTWSALLAMLPFRSRESIETFARHRGIVRRRGRGVERVSTPPLVVSRSPIENAMRAYGFPLAASGEPHPAMAMSGLVSSRW